MDFGRLLTGAAGRFVPGDDIFEDWSKSLKRLKDENPQWRPQHVENAWDLLTSPSKLLESVVSQSPYLASNMALMLAGFVTGGPVGAALSTVGPFALSFAVEGQSAYEDAIEYGATEEEAHFAGNVTGAISGLIEVMQIGGLVRFARGTKNTLVRTAAQRALKSAEGMFAKGLAKPTMELAKEMAKQSVEEMLQGTAQEAVAFQVYGKKIDEGFLDRRLQEAVGASATSILFGAGGRGFKSVLGGQPVLKDAMKTRDSSGAGYDAFMFAADLKNKFKYTDEEVSAVLAVTDARAQVWAQETGESPSAWYETHLAGVINQIEPGDVLFQDANAVGGMFLKSHKLIGEKMQETLTVDQAEAFFRKNGISEEELFWTGLRAQLDEAKAGDGKITRNDMEARLSETMFTVIREIRPEADDETLNRFQEMRGVASKLRSELNSKYTELKEALYKQGLNYDQANDVLRLADSDIDPQALGESSFNESVPLAVQEMYLEYIEHRRQTRNVETEYDRTLDNLREQTAKFGHFLYQRTGGENYREILIRLPWHTVDDMYQRSEEDYNNVPAGHWGKDFSVVSIRTTDRVDQKTGERALFVEEIQSDWGQARRHTEDARKKLPEILRKQEKGEQLTKQEDQLAREYNSVEDIPTVTKPPFLNTSQELAIKQLLLLAVQEGYTQVSFIRGDISAEMTGSQNPEGRKFAYDVRLPDALKKVLKQLGINESVIGTATHAYKLTLPGSAESRVNPRIWQRPREREGWSDYFKDDTQNGEFLTLKITPELARKVSEGLPLFQEGLTPQRPKDEAWKKYFDEELLSIAENQSPSSRETVIWMSPDDFLAAAADGVADEKTERVNRMVEAGEKFQPLYLSFDHDGQGKAWVTAHEGRHRARKMKELGITQVPVVFKSGERGRGRAIRWGEATNPRGLTQQTWPQTLKKERDRNAFGPDGQEKLDAIKEQINVLDREASNIRERVYGGTDMNGEKGYESEAERRAAWDRFLEIVNKDIPALEKAKDRLFGETDISIPFPVTEPEIQKPDTLHQEGNAIPFAGPRAAVTFLKDGRALLSALDKPDVSSVLHELGHIFRRDLYALAARPDGKVSQQVKQDIATIEQAFKVKDGVWTVDQEEAFAKSWEKYLAEGRTPSQGLFKVFEKMKVWFKKVYAGIANSPLDVKINKNMLPVFDRLLAKDTVEISAKRAELHLAQQEQRKARSERLGLKPSDQEIAVKAYELWKQLGEPQGMDNEIWTQAESLLNEQAGAPLKEANAKVKQLMIELRDLKETNAPKDDRPLLARGNELAREFLQTEDIQTRHSRSIFSRAWDKISVLGSMAAPLKRTKAGRMMVDVLNRMQSEVQSMMGRFSEPIARAVGQMTKADWNWLYEDPGQLGLPNFVRMVDQTGVDMSLQVEPPNERLKYLRDTLAEIQFTTGLEAEQVGVMQRLQDGSLQPFRRPKFLKLPRIPTDDMWQALTTKSGPLYEALRNQILRLNPELKDLGRHDELLLGPSGELTVRRSRALENTRAIRVMPYYVYVDGKAVEVFRTNPYDMMSKSVEFQARRIAYVKNLGHAGTLKPANLNSVKSFLKLMGINMGKVNEETLALRLEEAGVPMESFEGLTLKELKAIAKEEGIPTGWTMKDYLGQLQRLNPNRFDKRQQKLLTKLGKKLEGIKLDQEPVALMRDVIKRVQEPIVDIAGQLKAKHVQEAGYEAAGQMFEDVLTVWQGLPYHWFKRSTTTRGLRALSSVIGTMQTSLSVAPNIPQTLALVPGLTGLGNYLQAVSNVMKDPAMTRSQIAALGAFPLTVNSWALEKGYFVEGIARNMRQVSGELTGLRPVSELNSTIAGEAARLMVENWKNHKPSSGDLAVARRLGVSREVMNELKSGVVSEAGMKEVVQRMVAQTQFLTEAPHLKGKLENIPLLRIMFAYANYTLGQTRAVMGLMQDWKRVMAGRAGWNEGLRLVSQTTLNLAGMVGAGLAGHTLRMALKGQLTGEEDERIEDRLVSGLMEVQFFGAAQRMLEPFSHGNGIFEQGLIGTMPHLKAVMDGMKALLKMDRYADFDLGERITAAAKKNFPLFATLTGKVPTEIEFLENYAYPEFQQYTQAKRAGWKWIEEQPIVSRYAREGIKDRKGGGVFAANPDYDRVYQWVIRGQHVEAKEAVLALREQIRSEGGDVRENLTNLRRSLLNRSPIPVSSAEKWKFLRTLPEEKRMMFLQAERQFVRQVNRLVPRM